MRDDFNALVKCRRALKVTNCTATKSLLMQPGQSPHLNPNLCWDLKTHRWFPSTLTADEPFYKQKWTKYSICRRSKLVETSTKTPEHEIHLTILRQLWAALWWRILWNANKMNQSLWVEHDKRLQSSGHISAPLWSLLIWAWKAPIPDGQHRSAAALITRLLSSDWLPTINLSLLNPVKGGNPHKDLIKNVSDS